MIKDQELNRLGVRVTPPHLSMVEYAAFVDWSLKHQKRIYAERQKKIEEHITCRFVLVEE